MQIKPKFKIGNFKNTEDVTSHQSHHLHRKKSSSPGDRAGKQTQLINSKARLDMKATIRFSFHTPHSGPPFLNLIVNVLMFCQVNTFST